MTLEVNGAELESINTAFSFETGYHALKEGLQRFIEGNIESAKAFNVMQLDIDAEQVLSRLYEDYHGATKVILEIPAQLDSRKIYWSGCHQFVQNDSTQTLRDFYVVEEYSVDRDSYHEESTRLDRAYIIMQSPKSVFVRPASESCVTEIDKNKSKLHRIATKIFRSIYKK